MTVKLRNRMNSLFHSIMPITNYIPIERLETIPVSHVHLELLLNNTYVEQYYQ